MGHEVHTAEVGVQGLAKAKELNPDLIISDISMPNMNGHELARRLRASPQFSNTAVVAMTGFGQEEDRKVAIENGFDAHLTKPADLRALRELLQSI